MAGQRPSPTGFFFFLIYCLPVLFCVVHKGQRKKKEEANDRSRHAAPCVPRTKKVLPGLGALCCFFLLHGRSHHTGLLFLLFFFLFQGSRATLPPEKKGVAHKKVFSFFSLPASVRGPRHQAEAASTRSLSPEKDATTITREETPKHNITRGRSAGSPRGGGPDR